MLWALNWYETEDLWRGAEYLLILEQLLKIWVFLVTCYCSLASLNQMSFGVQIQSSR